MCLTLGMIVSPLSTSVKGPWARVQGKRPATAPTLGALLLERLALLGLHIANDTALVTRLARSLKFVADWHRPAAERATAAAAELSKVRQILLTCACSQLFNTGTLKTRLWIEAAFKGLCYGCNLKHVIQTQSFTHTFYGLQKFHHKRNES